MDSQLAARIATQSDSYRSGPGAARSVVRSPGPRSIVVSNTVCWTKRVGKRRGQCCDCNQDLCISWHFPRTVRDGRGVFGKAKELVELERRGLGQIAPRVHSQCLERLRNLSNTQYGITSPPGDDIDRLVAEPIAKQRICPAPLCACLLVVSLLAGWAPIGLLRPNSHLRR